MFLLVLAKKIKGYLQNSFLKKQFIFFVIYVALSLFFCSTLKYSSAFLLGLLLLIVFWKVFLGLSWVNVIYLFLALSEFKLLSLFSRQFFVFLSLGIFQFLFFQKLFASAEDCWRKIINFYLFFFWIFITYSLYFYLNWPFWSSFLSYLFGLFLFLYLYFLFSRRQFTKKHLIFLILGGEFYWLLAYLSLPLSLVSFILFSHYYFGLNYYLSSVVYSP